MQISSAQQKVIIWEIILVWIILLALSYARITSQSRVILGQIIFSSVFILAWLCYGTTIIEEESHLSNVDGNDYDIEQGDTAAIQQSAQRFRSSWFKKPFKIKKPF